MKEILNMFLYDKNFFCGVMFFIIAIPAAIYLLYRFVIESRDLAQRMKGFEFPRMTIRKAEYEWAKDYLKQKEEEKKNNK